MFDNILLRRIKRYPRNPDALVEIERGVYTDRGESDGSVIAVTRPNTPDGYWLCPLLAIAFFSYNVRVYLIQNYESFYPKSEFHEQYNLNDDYRLLTIAAINMCVASAQSIALIKKDRIPWWIDIGMYCISIIIASALYHLVVPLAIYYSVLVAILVTSAYIYAYVRVMNYCPKCFSYGEASIIVQGLLLFVLNTLMKLPTTFTAPTLHKQVRAVIALGLLYLLIFCVILHYSKFARKPKYFYSLFVLLLLASYCIPISHRLPVDILFEYITHKNRIWAFEGFLVILGLSIFIMYLMMSYNNRYFLRNMHKIFIIMIGFVYILGLQADCNLLYFLLTTVLIIFVLLETICILQMPPFGVMLFRALDNFAHPRDEGVIMVTPFTYIIACAMPLWITQPTCMEYGTMSIYPDDVLKACGFVTVAIADTLACIFGGNLEYDSEWRNFLDTSKTLPGSIVYLVSVFIGYCSLITYNYVDYSEFFLVAFTTMIIELMTNQIDNLVLPLVSFIMLCLRLPYSKDDDASPE